MPKSSRRILATERAVLAAKATGTRAEFRVKGAKNLVLRVTAGGAKTWNFLYRSPISGKRAKICIGSFPAKSLAKARSEALALTLNVEEGKDPLASRRSNLDAESFNALTKLYMAEHKVRNARGGSESVSTKEAQRILDADVLPSIADYKVDQVKKYHVTSIVEKIAARGSFVLADRALGLIRAIYNWANATGRSEVNPTFGLKKRNQGKPRDRVLSNDEIHALWKHLETQSRLSPGLRDAFKLELLLGRRINEIVGASKSEIDLAKALWVVPAIRTKGDRDIWVPLPPLALEIITGAIQRAENGEWLFPTAKKDRPIRTKSAVRAMARLRVQLGFGDVGTHDLRRTLATGMGNLGVPDEIIDNLLAHAPRSVAKKFYNHAKYVQPMRCALERWEAQIEAVISDKPIQSNVRPMKVAG